MALNEMIAQGAQFKMPDPLEQYGRIAQIQQAQNQNALAQYQINSAKRADETNTNFLSSLRAAGDDPAKVRQALMMAGKVKELGEFDVSALTRQETQGRIQDQLRKSFSADLLDLGSNPSDEKVIFLAKNIADDPKYPPPFKAIAQRKFAELIAMPFDKRQESLSMSGKAAETPDVVTMRALGYPLTQAGFQSYRDAQRQERMLNPAEEAQKIRIAAAMRPPAAPRPEQPPVAVVDPVTGRPVLVSREKSIGMTPANAMEGLTPKEIQKREAKYPQAITALKGFDAKTSKLERDIDDLITNKDGLNEITGYFAGRTDLSAMSKAGRRALSTFNTITAKGGFSELQDMRDASPTGGALGNVSNTEGQQLIASFGALARTQDADDLRNSLTTIKSDLQRSKQRVREAFDETYDYRANRANATAAPVTGVDASNPLLK
jgi:hypothetical protein